MVYGLTYGINALLLVFYPLAGFLADACWGRYITVKNSLCFLFWSIVLILNLSGLAVLGSTSMMIKADSFGTIQAITIAVLCVVFGLPVLSGLIQLLFCSIIAFSANIIQFELDQLHDAPAESLTLYIHWYVWTNQVGVFLLRLPSASLFNDSLKFNSICLQSWIDIFSTNSFRNHSLLGKIQTSLVLNRAWQCKPLQTGI